MPCLSVATLKSYINEKTKHEAKIVDLIFHKKDWKSYLKKTIIQTKPDLIGISVLSFNYSEAVHIAQFIKSKFNIKIIFGGVHVILSPGDVLENTVIDIVCTGEGEIPLKEILDNNLTCKNIKGIWYKENGKIIKNKRRKLIENLDSLPFPDFSDFDLERYFNLNNNHIPLMGSRGCPYNCTYCSNHALRKLLDGKYVRFRSPNNIIKEIDLRMKQFCKQGFKFLHLFDDTFILSKRFVFDFCKQYMEKNLQNKIKWTANVRANLVTNEIIKIMKDAGCYEVRMGVESGNNYILNTIYNRNITREQLENAIEIIKKNELLLRLDFILGAPFETIEMMEDTFEFAKQSGADRVVYAKLYPLPGTEIKKMCEVESLIEQKMDFHNSFINFITRGHGLFLVKGKLSVKKTKYTSKKQLDGISRKILLWQVQQYVHKGFKLGGIKFLWDIFTFLWYYKYKYGIEFNQIFRWNVQNYIYKTIV
jgi:radical SAM superfamily enzyme YgiQ (UPF0313 family)